MKKAWEIARSAQAKFGGSVRSFISESMKQAWAEYKLPSYEKWEARQEEYIPKVAEASVIDASEAVLVKSRKNDCYYMEEDLY